MAFCDSTYIWMSSKDIKSTWYRIVINYKICIENLFSDDVATVNSTNVTNTEDGQISGKDLNI